MLYVLFGVFSAVFFFFPGVEVRAEFFMEELNNGVKLCELIGVLQTKIAQSCPSALCKVSQMPAMKIARTIVRRAAFMLTHGDVHAELCRSHISFEEAVRWSFTEFYNILIPFTCFSFVPFLFVPGLKDEIALYNHGCMCSRGEEQLQ